MSTNIEHLFVLCKEQPFNIEKIKNYIIDNKLNSEQVTRVAIKLCNYGFCSYSDYLYENKKEPSSGDLTTYKWEELFDVLIEMGLDANLIICDDGHNYENVLQELRYFDDGDLGAEIARNILNNGGNPNIIIDGMPLFEEIDNDLIFDIQLGCYHHKWQQDKAFRYWLVMVGFGGTINNGQLPIEMCNRFKVDIFKEFEKFDYNVKWGEKDFDLEIFDKETGIVVGIA